MSTTPESFTGVPQPAVRTGSLQMLRGETNQILPTPETSENTEEPIFIITDTTSEKCFMFDAPKQSLSQRFKMYATERKINSFNNNQFNNGHNDQTSSRQGVHREIENQNYKPKKYEVEFKHCHNTAYNYDDTAYCNKNK